MDIIIVLVVVVIILSLFSSNKENFSARGTAFPPLGYPKYGLRGERLRIHALNDCYYDHYKCYENTYTPFFPPYGVDGCNCGLFGY